MTPSGRRELARLLLAWVSLLALLSAADGCSCAPVQRNISRSFCQQPDSFVFRVAGAPSARPADASIVYPVVVLLVLRGHHSLRQKSFVSTMDDPTMCGVQLRPGEAYVFHGEAAGGSRFALSACDDFRPASRLTAAELAFLVFGRRCERIVNGIR